MARKRITQRMREDFRRKVSGKTFERTFRVESARLADGSEAKLFPASISSELPVRRWFGDEILVHTKDAINMERAGNLPLLLNHDVDRALGMVRGFSLDAATKRTRADLEFDAQDDEGARWQSKVERGFAGDVSIRYSIDDYEIIERKDQEPEFRVTRWTPLEVSVVTVPADHSVGIGRQFEEGRTMTGSRNDDTVDHENGDTNVVSFEVGRSKGKGEGVAMERARLAGINDLFTACRWKGDEFDALKRDAIEKGLSVEQARAKLWEMINTGAYGEASPIAPAQRADQRASGSGGGYDAHGEDELDKLARGAERAMMFRAGVLPQTDKAVREEMRTNEFAHMRCSEVAREFLRRQGISTAGMDQVDLIRYALDPRQAPGGRRDLIGHGTSAFTNLLANTASKSLGMGYEEAEESWNQLVRIGSVPDFKQNDRPNLSAFSDLETVVEGGTYQHGTLSDKKEFIQALKKGRLFAITREALINDDLGAFTRIPRAMGRAANRAVGDAVYAILTNPPTMNEDAESLFRTSNTGTSGVISATTWGEMVKLFALQTDPSGNAVLNLRPVKLICPKAIDPVARILASAEFDPIGRTGATGGSRNPNIYRGTFEVVSDARLDADSAANWYASADPNMVDTIEVAFLGGRQEPYLESRNGWSVDGIEYKVRHEFGVSALDFRGLGYNAGG